MLLPASVTVPRVTLAFPVRWGRPNSFASAPVMVVPAFITVERKISVVVASPVICESTRSVAPASPTGRPPATASRTTLRPALIASVLEVLPRVSVPLLKIDWIDALFVTWILLAKVAPNPAEFAPLESKIRLPAFSRIVAEPIGLKEPAAEPPVSTSAGIAVMVSAVPTIPAPFAGRDRVMLLPEIAVMKAPAGIPVPLTDMPTVSPVALFSVMGLLPDE